MSDSSHSRLKRHCFKKWIEDYDAFKEFYPAVVVILINCQNQEMEKFLEGVSEPLPWIYLLVNLSDVLFKFIHALILYLTFKLRNITSF